jgi:hypothetical protein
MDHSRELEQLREGLRKETEQYKQHLDKELERLLGKLNDQARRRGLEGYKQMKAICDKDDQDALEFFERQIKLFGEEHLQRAEQAYKQRVKLNRRTLENYKKMFLS